MSSRMFKGEVYGSRMDWDGRLAVTITSRHSVVEYCPMAMVISCWGRL